MRSALTKCQGRSAVYTKSTAVVCGNQIPAISEPNRLSRYRLHRSARKYFRRQNYDDRPDNDNDDGDDGEDGRGLSISLDRSGRSARDVQSLPIFILIDTARKVVLECCSHGTQLQ